MKKNKISNKIAYIGLVFAVLLFVFLKVFELKSALFSLLFVLLITILYLSLILIIKNPYKTSLNYLKNSKKHIFSIICIFCFSAILGFIFYKNLSFLDILLEELVKKTINLKDFELFRFIFFNNLEVSFLGFILGIFLGIFSFFMACSNGLILGYVLGKSWEITGSTNFWKILPHGVFELPAIFISLGMGIKLGISVFSKNKFKEEFKESFITFLFIVIPLLLIAGIIETILIVISK